MKNILIIMLLWLLTACTSYNKAGFILPKSEEYILKITGGGGGGKLYYMSIPFNSNIFTSVYTSKIKNNRAIITTLPSRIEDNDCWTVSGFLVPLYIGKSCSMSWNSENDNFEIYVNKPYYTEEFLNNIQFSLKYENHIYYGQRRMSNMDGYIKFTFPITIKDIKNNGASIIVKYKDFYQEIPVSYQLRWY